MFSATEQICDYWDKLEVSKHPRGGGAKAIDLIALHILLSEPGKQARWTVIGGRFRSSLKYKPRARSPKPTLQVFRSGEEPTRTRPGLRLPAHSQPCPRRCSGLASSRLPFPASPRPGLPVDTLGDISTCRSAPSTQHGQQWRRRGRRLRGRLDPELHGGLSFTAFLSGRSREPPGRASPRSVPRGPGRNPQSLGFAATSPRRHCACATGTLRVQRANEKLNPRLPIPSPWPWTCLHGNLLHPSP